MILILTASSFSRKEWLIVGLVYHHLQYKLKQIEKKNQYFNYPKLARGKK